MAIINTGYGFPLCHVSRPPHPPSSTATHSSTDLLCILFKQAELEALVQLQLADVPGLVEVLSGGVQLVQQLGDPWHQALGVCVTHPPAAAAAAATAAAAASAIAAGKGLAALYPLEQPEGGTNITHSPQRCIILLCSTAAAPPPSDLFCASLRLGSVLCLLTSVPQCPVPQSGL